MENESGLNPSGELVVLRVPKVAGMTSGGIALTADTLKKEMHSTRVAYIVAMGPDAKKHFRTREMKVGDRIMLQKFGGEYFSVNGDYYLVMRPDSVLGWMEKDLDNPLNAPRSSEEVYPSNMPPANGEGSRIITPQ